MATQPQTLGSPIEQLAAVPAHVAIIMDGNGRWAKQRGLPRLAGHRAGTENIRKIIEGCVEYGVQYLTLYAFSTENWRRPEHEVRGLLTILGDVIDRETAELHRNGVRLRHIGVLDALPPRLQERVLYAVDLTRQNERLTVNVAFNYGGRAEIVEATRRMLRDGIDPSAVDEATFSSYLYTDGIPDPDLVVRTAGEMRLSNFLIWQAAYAEYYSTPRYWPEFGKEELAQAIREFARRERRFGGLPGAVAPGAGVAANGAPAGLRTTGEGGVAGAGHAARSRTGTGVSPLALRVLSALVGVPVLIGLTLVGGLPYVVAATLGAVRAMYEMLRMLRRAGYRPIEPLGYALVAALVLSAWSERPHAEAALMAVGVAAGLVWLLGRVDDPGAIVDWALTVAPALYVGLLLGFLVPLRDAPDGLGAFWVLAVLVTTWACDSSAYFVGSAWGRHKLAPRISPGKSVEGAVAGVLGAALAAGFLFAPVFAAVLAAATAAGLPVPDLPPFPSAARLMGLGLVVGLCAILGDLIESFVKRQCGAKDSGALIPGHGGVLDRMDSVMLAVVGAYLYVLATA